MPVDSAEIGCKTSALKLPPVKTKTDIAVILKFLFWSLLCSCHHEQINITCADPIGADDEVMERDFESSLYHSRYDIPWDFICFSQELNDCFGFDLTTDAPLIRAFYIPGQTNYGTIADVGPKECLGRVTEIPTTTWSYDAPIVVGHGYVVKKSDGSYGRFFVESWERTANGTIEQVNIIRQSSFY